MLRLLGRPWAFRRVLGMAGGGGVRYLLRDEFTTDRAAGAVNGTAAEPGPGTRTAVDTGSKLVIADPAITNILLFGDSMAAASAYNTIVVTSFPTAVYLEIPLRIGTGGARVATRYATFDADLASVYGTPDYIFFSLGTNDVGHPEDMVEADWKLKCAYMLEGFHAKWPAAQIYMARSWRRGYATECATINGWQDDMIAAYDYVHLGVDDWDCLEAGDDGATWTTDGQHPTTPAGYERRMTMYVASIAAPIISHQLGNRLWALDGTGAGDPGVWYGAQNRAAGRVLLGKVTPTWRSADSAAIGWDVNASGYPGAHAIRLGDSVVYVWHNNNAIVLGTFTLCREYDAAIVLGATGAYYLVRGGSEYPDWTMLGHRPTINTSPLYPTVQEMDNLTMFPSARIPDALWLPVPALYDTFTRADGEIGSSEVAGPDGQIVTARVWTGSTSTVSGNALMTTPTGAELASNCNMETGDPPTGWTAFGASTLSSVADERTGGVGAASLNIVRGTQSIVATQALASGAAGWYQIAAWVKSDGTSNGYLTWYDNVVSRNSLASMATDWVRLVVTGFTANGAPGQTRLGIGSGGTVVRFDDVSSKRLSVSSMLASADTGKVDLQHTVTVKALITGTQAGGVARLDDAASPANYLLFYFDGFGNVVLDEIVSGVKANLESAAKAYTAGDSLILDLSGSTYRFIHLTAAGVATVIDTGTTSVTNGTRCGTFSTWEGNTIETVEAYAKGAGGEYAALSSF